MTQLRDLLRQGIAALGAAGIEGAERDARVLLAHVLGIDRSRLTLVLPDPADPAVARAFMAAIRARAGHRPVSAILGYRDFYGRRFAVGDEVLDPRPETECLVELALREPFGRALDLGTGSGCILLTLLAERPGATGLGVDISPAALEVAARNAEALGVADRLALAEGDWFRGVGGCFDLIVSNPPYIAADEMPGLAEEVRAHDPRIALTDEGDGLGAYRRIADGTAAHLAPRGRLMVECGAGQSGAVRAIFEAAGLTGVAVHPDLDGRARVVAARRGAE